jgi:glycine cleavage system H lipoate-binding protein
MANSINLTKRSKENSTENPCLWMQAGAVKKKDCNNYFQCTTCKYDKGMEKMVAKGKQISWQDSMRQKDSSMRMCRHTLTQRMAEKVCPMNYNCSRCEFDQFFEEVLTPKTGRTDIQMTDVKGFQLAQDCHFHNGHTWAYVDDGGLIRIGFDDFSLKVMGEPDALMLPLTGQEINMGKAGWGLRRKDNSADVLSPVNGIIMEVNSDIRNNPGATAKDPYGNGWLFAVHTSDIKASMKVLIKDDDATEWISSEVGALENMIESVAGPITADGGYIQPDVFASLPSLGWNNLTRAFLKTG